MKDILINGKIYPMWQQFVQEKKDWIGGVLINRDMGLEVKTKIIDIELVANGEDSAYFSIIGKDFTCGGDVNFVGISSSQDKKGFLNISSTYCGDFFIKKARE